MARITVEDCVERIPSRFELVMLAAQRARDISAGEALTIDRDNDKAPVVALREIAEDTIDLDHLRYEIIHGLRRHIDHEQEDDSQQDVQQTLDQFMPAADFDEKNEPTDMEIGMMPIGMSYEDQDVPDED